MDRYHVTSTLGDGTYGSVLKAIHVVTGETVAIKRMKSTGFHWADAIKLPEVTVLRKLNHPNIVKLKEVIREKAGDLYFVFEYLDCNLYEAIKQRADTGKPFSELSIRNILWQILQGLAFMHRTHFHRDIKPENCLVRNSATVGSVAAAASAGLRRQVTPGLSEPIMFSPGAQVFQASSGDFTVKLADFGLAKEIRSRPPYTDYVSTRWYRAPEVLLRFPAYSSPVDIFAVGCIAAELFNMSPLFPGASEIDQMAKLCSILGAPTPTTWAQGARQASFLGVKLPPYAPRPLSLVIPSAPPDALNLIQSMLAWDPTKRISASAALQHPFFTGSVMLTRMFPALTSGESDAIAESSGMIQSEIDEISHTLAESKSRTALLHQHQRSSAAPSPAANPATSALRRVSSATGGDGEIDIDALIDDYMSSRKPGDEAPLELDVSESNKWASPSKPKRPPVSAALSPMSALLAETEVLSPAKKSNAPSWMAATRAAPHRYQLSQPQQHPDTTFTKRFGRDIDVSGHSNDSGSKHTSFTKRYGTGV
jgi:protein kinase